MEFQTATIHCCNCGMPFMVTLDFQRRRLADHEMFYCPAGHAQRYPGSTNEQKLREELTQVKKELLFCNNKLDVASCSNRSLRGVITRIKKGKKK